MRVPPMEVRRTTIPGGSAWTSPTRAAPDPNGFARERAQSRLRLIRRHHGDELPLVGHVEGVDPEQLASGGHGGLDRQRFLVEDHREVGIAGQLVADGAHASAGGVAQPAGVRCGGEQVFDESVQRSRVGRDVRLQGQVPTGQHDCSPVLAHGARHEHDVAHRDVGGSQVPAGWDHPDAGGRDVHAVRCATVDHLGVARDDGDSGEGGRLGHVGHHLAQDVDRQTLLEHEGSGDGERAGPHHGQVVDRPVHGQMAGGATGKSQGLHDIGVGAEGQAFARGEVDHGGVGLGRAPALLVLVGEGGQEDGVEQGGRRLATRAVGQGHDLVAQTGPPAPERLDAPEDRSLPVARRGVARYPRPDLSRHRSRRAPRCAGGRGERQVALDGFPQGEQEGVLDLLDPVDALGAHDQAVMDGFAHRHAGPLVAAQADRQEAPARRLLEGAQHVGRVAARGEADGYVVSVGVGDELAREDELEPDVVGERREDSLVVDQGEGGQRAPERGVAEQLRRPLGIGRAATVAEAEQPSAPGEALRHGDPGTLHLFGAPFERVGAQAGRLRPFSPGRT